MVRDGFVSRVKIQQIIENQLPEFISSENTKFVEFLKQYYISQEYQGGPIDIVENLDQYLKLDNFTPEIIVGESILTEDISNSSPIIRVESTKGFPQSYGLLKIDDEIITYTSSTENTFNGCIRGFSGITNYTENVDDQDNQELIFSKSNAASHNKNSVVENLNSLFLQEFYKKIKYTLTPGLENTTLSSKLNTGNFIKESSSFYKTKGTNESFRILFNALYNEIPTIKNLENFLIKSSSASYLRRKVVVAESISGNPSKLFGQTLIKSNDPTSTASISEVEIIRRKDKTYYKLLLFLGYDDSFPTITGSFNVTGATKNLNPISIGSSVIIVDSTIGFPPSGKIFYDSREISYTDKTVNQFLGCTGIDITIPNASTLYSEDTYYGYENGDLNKKVELRITGVLSDFNSIGEIYSSNEGEYIFVKNIGDNIKNPETNPTKKEIFANSWIYNTKSRYQIDYFIDGNDDGFADQLVVKSLIDKSSLRVGDYIDILNRNSELVVISNLKVIDIVDQIVKFDQPFVPSNSFRYDLRRIIQNGKSSIVPFEYSETFADIQNVYNENDEYMYVASNSIPSYEITIPLFSYDASGIDALDENTGLYSTIKFSENISFITGSEVYYKPSSTPIQGLKEGVYYIEVLPNKSSIKLYSSRSVVGSSNYVEFANFPGGIHNFTLFQQKQKIISEQKLLKKFPLNSDIATKEENITEIGTTGLLINGVEILNYKSNNKIYYGPLESVKILNGGLGYDVVNPPLLSVDYGDAKIQPIVRGSVEKIYVDPQDFDIDILVSVALTGGNGKGAVLEPIIEKRAREISFDARQTGYNGGVDTDNETITFKNPHGLIDGQIIFYNPQNNDPLGISTFKGTDSDTGITLKQNSNYIAKFINDRTIQLYQSISDYNAGINTVGFTTVGTSGIHKFYTELKNTLSDIKVVNSGSGYENRKLRVFTSGISTSNSTVFFKNHGFKDGELISYEYENSAIVGLSTLNQYYILKIDENYFQLSNAGIGGTYSTNYEKRNNVRFGSTGSGYQIFKYPDIVLSVNYSAIGIGSTQFKGSIVATPIVRGEIIDAYLYDKGVGYGSTILNLHKKPIVQIKNGKRSQINPIVVNGRIIDVSVLYGGEEYYSQPDIKVFGSGTGAVLKAVIKDNKIVGITIINGGFGYSPLDTIIKVQSAGQGALLDCQVRELTVNNNVFYKDINDTLLQNNGEILTTVSNKLQYFISSYPQKIQNIFNEDSDSHSKIIGWAYDGNPIYGSYGYSDPKDKNSAIKRILSGYTLNTNNIFDRPSGFEDGFFVDDYKFINSGDLDEYNGRFCITPEFPNGVYAYFATSKININDASIIGSFPYFIGNKYRSKFITENKKINQSFDFNNSKLVRNTFPYKINEKYASNDFIIESNKLVNQSFIIDSIKKGSVEGFNIIDSGDNYKVNDKLVLDEDNTSGFGVDAKVLEVKGRLIQDIQTSSIDYQNAIFILKNNQQIDVFFDSDSEYSLKNLDYVSISGFSTQSSFINGIYQVGITSYISSLEENIPAVSGIVTDIYVSNIPSDVSVGSSIRIDQEIFSILNLYKNENVIRVKRNPVGSSHTASSAIYFIPNKFTINKNIGNFGSSLNEKIYFNPTQTVGVGTTPGSTIKLKYRTGSKIKDIFVPTQSIYLPNHPFKTNQQVILEKLSTSAPLSVSNSSSGFSFNLPYFGNQEIVYIINKSQDHIGIVTQIGLTTSTNGLFFSGNGTDDFEYSIRSNEKQLLGNVKKIITKVSISTNHNLLEGDVINLTVKPNLSIGIGQSSYIKLKYDDSRKKLILNPKDFTSSSINIVTDEITIPNHNFRTSDKVIYTSSSVAVGLTEGSYYIFKIDDNRIKLCETLIDSKTEPPTTVNIINAPAATHYLSLINPPLYPTKGNDLVFDLSDSSLSGYKLKIFYDDNFRKEFVSTKTETEFSVVSIGSSVILKYNDAINFPLFYSLEKSGYISTADTEVSNHSQISFVPSIYNGSYTISGIGTTTFNILMSYSPEKSSYNQSECSDLSYTTSSTTASGPISKIRTVSSGLNYKKLPVFKTVLSNSGTNAYIVPESQSIGKVGEIRILNNGFEYPSDKTLRPEALLSTILTIKDSYTISNISVLDGGKNYISTPNIIVFDTKTGKKLDSGLLVPNLSGSSITSVDIVQNPKGLTNGDVDLRAVNNSNGVRVEFVQSSSSGIVTCILVTPLSGFSQEPFAIGDKVFVEGIVKDDVNGDGFNSENYSYKFFTVTNYLNSGTSLPRRLEFTGVSTNPGIAKTVQDFYATVVNYKNYPKFSVIKSDTTFIIDENIEVNREFGFENVNTKVLQSNKNFIKVSGSFNFKKNDIIRGTQSGTLATINNIKESFGYFNVGYASTQLIGWENDIGKLDDDNQVIADNDYYQNLSYSIKSKQTWSNVVSVVNDLLHPSGFKNFADTEILKTVNLGITTTVTEYTNILYKFVTENRVDTVNNFDLSIDIDTVDNSSIFLKLKNKKLTDYIEIRTNRVLPIDDISPQFYSQEENQGFELTYENLPIFKKSFNPATALDTTSGKFTINSHFFQTGEELFYRPLTAVGSAGTAIAIGPTLSYTGITTNILPSKVYAIRIDNDNFKIATRREYALSNPPISISIANVGYGNSHEFEMVKKNDKCLLTINNIVQSPIAYSLLKYNTNNPTTIGIASSIFPLTGISSIRVNDILKIDDEYMKVINVGLGTSVSGPISFAGTFPLVYVQRGFIGSSSTTHSGISSVTLYRGSFNIERNKVYFTESLANTLDDEEFLDNTGLPYFNFNFHGRVFLRKNYDTNQVFDNISERFTGIGQTYTITVGGANTIGLGTVAGNGIVFLNGIFQTPLTENNNLEVGNNYSVIENVNVGVSSVVFAGLKLPSGKQFITDYDVNMNDLPRGGVIVSLGSTPGLGYAPLVGASVTAIIGPGGSITAIGIGTTGNWGSGYRNPVSIAITESGHTGTMSSITATVGYGGTLSFNIIVGGSGYVNPTINISPPSYSNLPVIGVSRLSTGSTTSTGVGLLLNVEVGASSTTGIGSTLFQVTNFKVVRNGFGFEKGDVVTPVGLVTDAKLPNPISKFELTILDTFTDSFSGWQFGQIDYIDSIKNYQDGSRTRFPLYYNSSLLSFEKNDFDPESQLITYFDSLLIIFINGVLQEPGVSYQFTGGTSFTFSSPPRPEDNISVFFYRGSLDDSSQIDITETIKEGDTVQVLKNNNYLGLTTSQDPRVITDISSSDIVQTNPYNREGIDRNYFKPLNWIKQKKDAIINGQYISKSRDSLETQIYPTAKIISDLSTTDSQIFVDNSTLFDYENSLEIEFDGLIVSGKSDPISASAVATVSLASTISSITITNGGSGYTPGSTFAISIAKPIGIGITATATATASSSGIITSISITNPGFGYSSQTLPNILIPFPDVVTDNLRKISTVEGFSGYITGIQTVSGIGTNMAIKFTLNSPTGFAGLSTGYPIYIFDTYVGKGVTSIYNSNNAIVGIGTTFLDNIYYIQQFNASVGVITCNIHSQTNVIGITTTGAIVGKFSWGRLSGFSRSLPVSIAVSSYTVDAGLSTFPTIQRRGYGLRNIGPLKKIL